MKTLGTVLIIMGLLVSIMGYGQYANVVCYCPAHVAGHLFNCTCGTHLQQLAGRVMVYIGLAFFASGLVLFIQGWRKKIILN